MGVVRLLLARYLFTAGCLCSPPFPIAIMSLSKHEDTAVQMERVSSSDLDAEKAHATEHAERLSELADPDAGKSPEERAAIDRKLMRKVDLWLIPWLCLLYLLSFLDRSNIGNARLAGMEEDLDMGGHDYNNALTIFFISYALAEPITNVLLKRLTPRVFFTGIILLWGLIMTLMGLVTNYAGLLACRWFLGLAEAGLFPGVNYYLSCWYKRSELGMRAAVFFSAAALAGSFGGLLAAAIAQMEGVGGKAGWAWIFIIEGLATMFVGCFCWGMVFDWPATARFLTEEDRLRLRRRLAADNQSSTAEEYDKRHVIAALKDWKCWGYAFIYMGNLCPLYAFSLFLPTILAGMGYKGTHAQLLSVPPCSGCDLHDCSRLDCRPNASAWPLQHGHRHCCCDRFLHAAGYSEPQNPVCRYIFGCGRNLPHHSKHPVVGQQQHRGHLQTRRHHRHCCRLGQSQRSCQLQHLHQGGEAKILYRPWYRSGLPHRLPAWRHHLHVYHAASGKQEEA